jgi:hypothetical protein
MNITRGISDSIGMHTGRCIFVNSGITEDIIEDITKEGCGGGQREDGCLFGTRLSSASGFKLRWEAISQVVVPFPKRFRGGCGLYR